MIKLKSPITRGIGYIRDNQTEARSYHLRSLDLVHKNLTIDVMKIEQPEVYHIAPENFDCRDDTFKPQPVEETVKVQLGFEEAQTTEQWIDRG